MLLDARLVNVDKGFAGSLSSGQQTSGAYLVGTRYGREKGVPKISPK